MHAAFLPICKLPFQGAGSSAPSCVNSLINFGRGTEVQLACIGVSRQKGCLMSAAQIRHFMAAHMDSMMCTGSLRLVALLLTMVATPFSTIHSPLEPFSVTGTGLVETNLYPSLLARSWCHFGHALVENTPEILSILLDVHGVYVKCDFTVMHFPRA